MKMRGILRFSSPSVCVSQVGVLRRRLKHGSHKQRHTIAPGLLIFLTPKISTKFQRDHPERGRQIEVGYMLKRRFSTNISLYIRIGAKYGNSYYRKLIRPVRNIVEKLNLAPWLTVASAGPWMAKHP